MQFDYLARKPPFDTEAKRAELAQRLNAIGGVEIPLDAITGRLPSFPLATLRNDQALTPFFDTLDWFVSEVRATPETDRSLA